MDLMNYGEAIEALAGAWGVMQLAAIPAPGLFPPERTFRENDLSTFNIFQAATLFKVSCVVWASSKTALGLPFDKVQLAVAPVDESHYPFPKTKLAPGTGSRDTLLGIAKTKRLLSFAPKHLLCDAATA